MPADLPDRPDSSRDRPPADLRRQRLPAVAAAALLLFNFPLLALWDHPVLVLGLPLLPTMLFGLWALLIVLLAWLMERD